MIIINDGTLIYSRDTLIEWLRDKGLDDFSLEEFLDMCQDPTIKQDVEWYKDNYEGMEREADGYYCNLRDLAQEVENLANKLATGKGGTKAQYAEKFKKLADYYGV